MSFSLNRSGYGIKCCFSFDRTAAKIVYDPDTTNDEPSNTFS